MFSHHIKIHSNYQYLRLVHRKRIACIDSGNAFYSFRNKPRCTYFFRNGNKFYFL